MKLTPPFTDAMDRQRPYGNNRGNNPSGKKVRKMVALYDYDPQELSPNVDAEVKKEEESTMCLLSSSFFSRFSSGPRDKPLHLLILIEHKK